MARTKICGITNRADLQAAVEAGTDAIGIISAVDVATTREVDRGTAAELVAAVPPFVTATLVAMPDDTDHAVELVRAIQPDALQLHGTFDADDLGYIRAETGVKIIAAVDYADTDRAAALDGVADALLVDSTTDEGAGGTGEPHDWEATADLAETLTTPVILAGGLTPDNVAAAIRAAAPFGVDVASGVERSEGSKNHTAVATFVQNAGREIEVPA